MTKAATSVGNSDPASVDQQAQLTTPKTDTAALDEPLGAKLPRDENLKEAAENKAR